VGDDAAECGDPDDATARQVARDCDAEALLDLLDGFVIPPSSRMNEHWTAIACRPGAVLNFLDAAYDEMGPRLADRENSHRVCHGVMAGD
jgi:hypothetical protein